VNQHAKCLVKRSLSSNFVVCSQKSCKDIWFSKQLTHEQMPDGHYCYNSIMLCMAMLWWPTTKMQCQQAKNYMQIRRIKKLY